MKNRKSSQLLNQISRIKEPKRGLQIDRHHVIAKSLSGYNVHHIGNIVRLPHDMHFGLHALFGTCTPQEQLYMLAFINKGVLSEKAIALLQELFEMEETDFYKSWCIR